jgi:hypothetical protein
LQYVDPSGHFSDKPGGEIEQYLRNTYGDKWRLYWDAWKSDKLFWEMLLAADYGYTLFAPTTQLGPGVFVRGEDGTFLFQAAHGLEAYQGNGPYKLLDSAGDPVEGFTARATFEAGLIESLFMAGAHEFSSNWNEHRQPVYLYTDEGPVPTGWWRRVSYEATGSGRFLLNPLSAGFWSDLVGLLKEGNIPWGVLDAVQVQYAPRIYYESPSALTVYAPDWRAAPSIHPDSFTTLIPYQVVTWKPAR